MPELPEVEIIKLGLQKKIIGLKIQKIQVLSPKSFIGNPNLAQGKIVLKLWRKAKILGVDLSSSLRDPASGGTKQSSTDNHEIATSSATIHPSFGGKVRTPRNDKEVTLLIHLKMSGQLIWEGDSKFIGGHPTENMLGKMPNPHTRVIFSFSDGSHLYFNDQRKFGWVKVIESDKGKVISDKSLQNLGPEPLEESFTWQILKQNLLRHKSMPVKVAIMDQSVVSGVGNIYSNEACFDAKIDPGKKVSELSDQEFKSLHQGVIKSLRDGIKHGGSTRAQFVDPEGHKGYFLDYAYVYGRDKHPCKARLPDGQVCGTEIKKIQLGGRGTYFCPSCQT